MKISGLVQARMGSKRLPGKVMLEIQGKPLIGHIFDRLKSINSLKNIILATTKDPKNNELKNYALQQNIKVYQHDIENDIVGRLYNSMKLTKADAILKINADCPIVDPKLLEEGLNIFYRKKSSYDLLTNKISKKFPDGYSYEILSQKVIKWCHENLVNLEDRELVVMWIIKNKNRFKNIYSVSTHLNYKKLNLPNLCVDTQKDFILISKIFNKLYKKNRLFGIDEVSKVFENIL